MKGVIQKIQMDGPDCSKKALRGRPKKKPGYDKEQHIQNLIDQAVALFGEPYDDRIERPDDAPTITTVAEAMGTSRIRVRKMKLSISVQSKNTQNFTQLTRPCLLSASSPAAVRAG